MRTIILLSVFCYSLFGQTQFASDNFTRANGALGANWANDTTLEGVTQISSNQVIAVAGRGSAFYYGGLAWNTDQYSQVKLIAQSSGSIGPTVRETSSGNFYGCTASGLGTGTADAFILLRSGGSQSVLASTSANTILANDDVRCSIQGNTITFTDVTQGTTLVSTTDSTIPAGYPGIYIGGSGSILTNWAGGGYASLPQLTTIATDNFQRADSPTLGANWTVGHGTFALQIISDQVESAGQGQPPGAGHGKEYYSAISFASDQWSQAAVVSSTNDVNGAITRYQGSVDTHYVGFVSQTGGAGICSVSIDVDIAGAPTVIATDSTYCSVTASDIIQLSSRGSLHTLVDITSGAVLLAAIDTQITGGAPGWSVSPTGGTPIMDNWSGGGFSSGVPRVRTVIQ